MGYKTSGLPRYMLLSDSLQKEKVTDGRLQSWILGENDDKEKVINSFTCGYEYEHNCLQRGAFGVIARVEDFLVNNRLPFIQSARATACRHSWGVTLRGTMGPRPKGTTGRACTENCQLFCICSEVMGAFETL